MAIGEDYRRGDPFERIDRDFQLMTDLGLSEWRGSISWIDQEPVRGQYDFAWLDEFLVRAERHGITLHPYVAYTPAFAARPTGSTENRWNRPPANEADWMRFVDALGRRLMRHRNVASIEIYNEENASEWWDGKAADYARVVIDARRALPARFRVPIVLGGLVFPDSAWVRNVCAVSGAAASFSVLPIHAYPETWLPPDVTVESYASSIAPFVRDADAACGRKSIWVNEAGAPTTADKNERDQARWWVRPVASSLAEPRIEQIGIYRLRDLPVDQPSIGGEPNYHLGLVYTDGRPKLAFHTIRLLHDLLDVGRLTSLDSGFIVTSPHPGELHAHLFERADGDRVLIMWDRTETSMASVQLGESGSGLVEYALDGTRVESPVFDGRAFRERLERGEPRIYRIVSRDSDERRR